MKTASEIRKEFRQELSDMLINYIDKCDQANIDHAEPVSGIIVIMSDAIGKALVTAVPVGVLDEAIAKIGKIIKAYTIEGKQMLAAAQTSENADNFVSGQASKMALEAIQKASQHE